jgi:hypothetical protein
MSHKGLVVSLWCYWEVGEPLGGGVYWKEDRSLGACIGGILGALPLCASQQP